MWLYSAGGGPTGTRVGHDHRLLGIRMAKQSVQAGPVTSTGIRELKDNLSRYLRRIEAGERIVITAHGRVVAELVQPGATTKSTSRRFDELVASGVIRPPLEAGDPTEAWPDIRLPSGTAAELIDAERGEA